MTSQRSGRYRARLRPGVREWPLSRILMNYWRMEPLPAEMGAPPLPPRPPAPPTAGFASPPDGAGRRLWAGKRLRCSLCSTQIVIVRPCIGLSTLTCCDTPLVGIEDAPLWGGLDVEGDAVRGKRYLDHDGTLEILCTKAGRGPLLWNEERLGIKGTPT